MLTCLEIEDTEEANKFIEETRQRFKAEYHAVKNPMIKGAIKRSVLLPAGPVYLAVQIEHNLPPFYFVGFVPMFGSLLFNWPWYVMLIGWMIVTTAFFDTHYFVYFMLKAGLKKAGYKGKVKLLSYADFIKRVCL